MVLKNGGVAEYERILKSFYDTEDNALRIIVMHTLGCTSDPALKRRTLDWAVMGTDVKLQDFFYPIGAVSSRCSPLLALPSHPATSLNGADLSWNYYKEVRLPPSLPRPSPHGCL
jgi:hypothetical protein